MKKVELSEVKAMLTEILAATSASNESIGTILKLGSGTIDINRLGGFGELRAPLKTIVKAAESVEGGKILVDESTWEELEGIYYSRVTRHLFF